MPSVASALLLPHATLVPPTAHLPLTTRLPPTTYVRPASRAPPPLLLGRPRLDLVGRIDRWWSERRDQSHWRRDRPERIILVRHGQSCGNTDKKFFSTVPDSQIPLTDRGYAQAAVAGLKIRNLVGNESVRFFHSPYMRTRQTLLALLRAFDKLPVLLTSEPRLREQDFGNFQDPQAMDAIFEERARFGRFFFWFPNGEAGTDVYDRVASFLTYLFRTMGGTKSAAFAEATAGEPRPRTPVRNYVLVTHGLLMRVFCMCYLRWTVDEFERVWNPSNGEVWVLQKVDGRGIYRLEGRYCTTNGGRRGGRYVDVKYGLNQTQAMPRNMKQPNPSRRVVPGAPDAFDAPQFAHMKDVPGPGRWNRGDWESWTAEREVLARGEVATGRGWESDARR